MSFMFNPFPYDDFSAQNPVSWAGSEKAEIVKGNLEVASFLSGKILSKVKTKKKLVIGLDGYAAAGFDEITRLISRKLFEAGHVDITLLPVSDLYKSSEELDKQFQDYLPTNIEEDPVLLYGRLFDGSEDVFFDKNKLENLVKNVNAKTEGIIFVYGNFAGTKLLTEIFDLLLYIDIIPKNAVLRLKTGKAANIGVSSIKTYRELMRRSYYVDFELSLKLRAELLKLNKIDWYILQDADDKLLMLGWDTLKKACDALVKKPFRCKPVYNEGVWGGQFTKKLRNLPESMKNCAWVFELIPSEVSLVLVINKVLVDIPFYTFIKMKAKELLGKESITRFGEYFPIRFNYDDTIHSSGNMSIQVHPGEKYCKQVFNELGRQDESYYIVAAGPGAKTYCGFKDSANVKEFISLIKASEKSGKEVPYDDFVDSIDSVPGMQFLLPAGTVHASGRNQMVLEMGSLTVGSYTFKLYDYVRKDIDGTIRPIHALHGERVLEYDRTSSWVKKNIFVPPVEKESGEGWRELLLGEHELVYFSPRRLEFNKQVKQDTQGKFHVLALVEGESVKVVSEKDESQFFVMKYLEIVIVPAMLGAYKIVNLGSQPAAIYKALVK